MPWLIRAVVSLVLTDDVIKYGLMFIAGLVAFTVLEIGSFQTVMQSQPWGSWWGATGATVPAQVNGPVISPVVVPTLAPLQMAPPASSDRVGTWLANAHTWLNVRYLFGGCSRAGIDCSCFVQNTLRTIGISAPRTTTGQIRWTRPVSRVEAQPGDLVYFDNTYPDVNPTHVGIYIGDGQMIQAGGSQVSIQPAFTGWYGAHYSSMGRVPGL
jgi:cell wall-associated NlpC family hydrolase